MEHLTNLSETQKVSLDKLTTALGPYYVEYLVSQDPDMFNARLEIFMRYETTLVEQVQDQFTSALLIRFVSMPDDGDMTLKVKLDIKPYSIRKK